MAPRGPTASIGIVKHPHGRGHGGHDVPGILPGVSIKGTQATSVLVPIGTVLFWPVGHDDHALLLTMGDQGFVHDESTGGWDTVQRPNGFPLTVWRGLPGGPGSVDVILDEFAQGGSVDDIRDLLRSYMGFGPTPMNNGVAPPAIIIAQGEGKPVEQAKADRYGITGIDWDYPNAIRGDGGHFQRLDALIHFTWLNRPSLVHDQVAQVRADRGRAKTKPYKAQKGDTAISIARTKLGDAGRWPEIISANSGISKDPRAKIKPGTPVVIV